MWVSAAFSLRESDKAAMLAGMLISIAVFFILSNRTDSGGMR
jgi:hypothetical protein